MLPDQTQQEFDEAKRPLRMLRLREVKHLTGLGTSTIYLKMSRGEFPRQIPLGEAAVGWSSREIESWLEAQCAKRDAGDPWQQLGDSATRVVAKLGDQLDKRPRGHNAALAGADEVVGIKSRG
jgi:prophage regulatory protein